MTKQDVIIDPTDTLGNRSSIDSTSPLTSISYTLCSFNEMTAAVGGGLGGAAIYLCNSSASLTIDQCFFHKCTVTQSDDDGGAIFVSYWYNSVHPVTITNTTFTECSSSFSDSSPNYGGGLCCLVSSQTTLDKCFFESCSSQGAGAVYTFSTPLTLSNCAFVLCSATSNGGALFLNYLPRIDFSFVQFRECVCINDRRSKDIFFRDMPSLQITSAMVRFCDSTSGKPNVMFDIGSLNDSRLVPQLTEEQKTGISSFEVSMGEDTATITIRTTKEMKGTMGVLLEGSNVPRLVHVSFGTADMESSTGTVEVSIGLEGVLPIISEGKSYTIRSASIPGWSIDASILSVFAELEVTSEASFELTGRLLKTGTYLMKVKDSEDNNFAISLSLSSGSLTGTSQLSSTDSTKLKYEQEYEVVEVSCDSQPLVQVASFSFSIPYPPATLTGIEQTDGNDSMSIGFVGTGFVASGYKVRVTEVGVEEPSTLTVDLLPSSESRLTEWTAKLYPFSKADLKYGTEYEVSSFVPSDDKQTVSTSSLTFHTPAEPARIEKCLKAELHKDRTKISLFFEGRALHSEMGLIWLKDGSTFWSSVSPLNATDSTHCFADFSVSSSESVESLEFGKEYTVSIKTGETASFIVNDEIKARIPFPPRLLSASFAFTNTLLTSCSVSFVGSDLPVGKDFRVTLSPSLSFVIGVVDAEHAESSRLRIGWPDSLEFSRNYTISSIVGLDEDEDEILFDPSLSFETEAGPTKLTLFVDSSSGSLEWFCGEESLPCSTIEAAWWIVDGIGVSKVTLDIVHNTTQSTPIVISKGMKVGVKSGETTKPELFVSPLPAQEEEEGVISVIEASLWMNQVDIVLTDSPSLIFILVVNGTLTLQLCSIVGSTQSPSPTLNSELFSCSWKSGAFVLKNSTTKIVSSSFSLLSSGAVWMEGGSLTVETSAFHDNSPHDALFPSARRNIGCSSGGRMMIGSLSGGDGTPTSPSPWISQNDCTMEGLESIRSAPLFIPTLSSSESSSEFSKKNKTFSMWIVGSTLIPCGLCLEVFEIVSSKSETVGRAKLFDLSSESTEWKNETHICVSISSSSLSSLDSSLEWRGRLLFGSHSTPTSDSSSESESFSSELLRTSESFQIQTSISERRSQSVKENMKWWLPLVIALCVLVLLLMVVVFVCWRRHRMGEMKNKEKMKTTEMVEEDEAQLALEQKLEGTISENSVDQLIKMNQTVRPQQVNEKEASETLPMEKQRFVEVLGESGEIGVVDWTNADPLFDILHRPEKQRSFDKRMMSVREHKNSRIVTCFSPHWVLVNNSSVLLRLAPIGEDREETEVKNENEIPEQEHEQQPECKKSFFGGRLSAPTGKAAEGLRWRAPEIGAWSGEKIDGESALVFSLGLVLWEIWTGEVPWKEMDEANAGRQNEGGVQPNMKLVLDEGIRSLISQSLSLDPKERPSLKSVVGVLCSLEAADEDEDAGNRKASDQLGIRS
ncbi:hypothetical protein BLNAU_11025 [Blattamonas nauphoetae]|uniref:Serine-threonine/tyrosine-protein kinase catalytic domain-containing protein n=1 Tax=Blattamonas nauphoetae TaxID=2049346 RepID=A0ABQ9XRB7_9EUKA|nr:hypothetical protein BLNAU_11025 [Blattamonas nauphoetae]